MTVTDFKQSQVALACWRAAQTELHQTMLAVCQVFLNRAAAGWYDGDLYENCYHWLEENPGEFPDTRDPQFQQLLSRIDSVTSKLVSDVTGRAIYFVPKVDFDEAILPSQYSITTTIGSLVFIKGRE